MSRVSTYINTLGRTEEAFHFYEKVFNTSIAALHRFSDAPETSACLSPEEANGIIHVELPILNGHMLMGTDVVASSDRPCTTGNNMSINLEPDTRAEAEHIHSVLSVGATQDTGLNDMPWGAYWACVFDKFGVVWQINVTNSAG